VALHCICANVVDSHIGRQFPQTRKTTVKSICYQQTKTAYLSPYTRCRFLLGLTLGTGRSSCFRASVRSAGLTATDDLDLEWRNGGDSCRLECIDGGVLESGGDINGGLVSEAPSAAASADAF